MIRIYYSHYKNRLDVLSFNKKLEVLPEGIKLKILKYQRWEDAHASLFGKMILKKGLRDFGFDDTLVDLKYNSYSRPHLTDSIDFNISHSGDYVICVLSTLGSVGIDLEVIKPITISDFKNTFSPSEWDKINQSKKPIVDFYSYWTAKEAIIKANGKGLHTPLDEFSVTSQQVILDNQLWYIKEIPFIKNYCLHLASNLKIPERIDIEEVVI